MRIGALLRLDKLLKDVVEQGKGQYKDWLWWGSYLREENIISGKKTIQWLFIR